MPKIFYRRGSDRKVIRVIKERTRTVLDIRHCFLPEDEGEYVWTRMGIRINGEKNNVLNFISLLAAEVKENLGITEAELIDAVRSGTKKTAATKKAARRTKHTK